MRDVIMVGIGFVAASVFWVGGYYFLVLRQFAGPRLARLIAPRDRKIGPG